MFQAFSSAVCRRSLLLVLIAGSAALAPLSQATAADAAATVFYGGTVFTADPAHPQAEAIAIRGDRILAVGTRATVEQAAGPAARKVDLKGRFLMPGMIDAHAHPLSEGVSGGLTLVKLSFPDEGGDVAKLTQFVAKHINDADSHQGDVLVVTNLDIGYWTHAAQIDAALSHGEFTGKPIVLWGGDGHTGWANRALRDRAGITRAYLRGLKDSERRFYGADEHFNPNGFVVDDGMVTVRKVLPPDSPQTLLEAGKAAVHYMNSLGLTGWLDAAVAGAVASTAPLQAGDEGGLPVYRELSRKGLLTGHVAAYPVIAPDAGFGQIDLVQTLQKKFAGVENLRVPGLKVFADGVVEYPSQTAALTKAYLKTNKVVKPLFTPAKTNALVAEAYRRGLTVHVHAIGDLAVKDSLDAFEAARRANPDTKLPMVITHVQFADPEDFPRFRKLHVIAALQLLWAAANYDSVEAIKPWLDPGIYRWQYPARSILDAGGEIAGASDWPVSTANPFLAMTIAETRRGPEGVLDARQRMPREAMLYAYTRNSADVLGEQDQIGSLAPGKRADLVLLDRNVLTVPVAQLPETRVLFTMFGGKVVYGKEP
ncbi:MAG: amidohydrolase [Proteobacteria bacterium]|nr:amidohydrolase [Pseudomonadota bacterium]